MSFEKLKIQKERTKLLYNIDDFINEIEIIYNSLDKEEKNILKFNYIGREILEYADKNKNGRFWFNDAMIFKRKYFLFGEFVATFKWACSFSPDLYQHSTDISKLNLKSLKNLETFLTYYKKDLENLKGETQ